MKKERLKLLKDNVIIAISPHYDGTHSSVIFTHQGSLYCEETVQKILDQFCIAFGSTLEGRKNGTRQQLNVTKNPPILISEKYQAVAFQVPDYKTMETMWIFDLNFTIVPISPMVCRLDFGRGFSLIVPLSENAIIDRKRKTLELLYSCII